MKSYQKILIIVAVLAFAGLAYYYYGLRKPQEQEQETANIVPILNRPEYASNINQAASQAPSDDQAAAAVPAAAQNPAVVADTSLEVSPYTLKIDGIGLSAPLILNVEGNDQETYLKALEKGVAHMARTASLGEPGNTVLFGHSSYFKNKPGNFKTVFATLDKVNQGDTITISSSDKTFSYVVTEEKTVQPDDISIVAQDLSKHSLTIVTCWPPNTTDQRYVVTAELRN